MAIPEHQKDDLKHQSTPPKIRRLRHPEINKERLMAKFVFVMNQSLDGYVDHLRFPSAPGPELYDEYIRLTKNLAGSLYGRRLYESMRYWDDDYSDWDDAKREFALAWRKAPKWVVSLTLDHVGNNATLIRDDVEGTIRRLKHEFEGEIQVGGPQLADSLTRWGLIDEYRIFLHPAVLGEGTPFFANPRPPLHLVSTERFDNDVLKLTYVPTLSPR
jgi:dihydrofolate reductase